MCFHWAFLHVIKCCRSVSDLSTKTAENIKLLRQPLLIEANHKGHCQGFQIKSIVQHMQDIFRFVDPISKRIVASGPENQLLLNLRNSFDLAIKVYSDISRLWASESPQCKTIQMKQPTNNLFVYTPYEQPEVTDLSSHRKQTLRRCYSRVKEHGIGKRKSSYTIEQLEKVFGQGGWDSQSCAPVLINSSGLYQEMESDGSTLEDFSQEDWCNQVLDSAFQEGDMETGECVAEQRSDS